jgi:hypothetical protein
MHTSVYVSIRQHTSAYASIRQHTPAYISIRQERICRGGASRKVKHKKPAQRRSIGGGSRSWGVCHALQGGNGLSREPREDAGEESTESVSSWVCLLVSPCWVAGGGCHALGGGLS